MEKETMNAKLASVDALVAECMRHITEKALLRGEIIALKEKLAKLRRQARRGEQV